MFQLVGVPICGLIQFGWILQCSNCCIFDLICTLFFVYKSQFFKRFALNFKNFNRFIISYVLLSFVHKISRSSSRIWFLINFQFQKNVFLPHSKILFMKRTLNGNKSRKYVGELGIHSLIKLRIFQNGMITQSDRNKTVSLLISPLKITFFLFS